MIAILRRLLENFERKILFGRYDIDPDAASKPAAGDDAVRSRLYEVKTKQGWRVWRR